MDPAQSTTPQGGSSPAPESTGGKSTTSQDNLSSATSSAPTVVDTSCRQDEGGERDGKAETGGASEYKPVPTPAQVKADMQFFECRFCGLTFNYINTLRSHERVHGVETPYVCGQCGESFHFSCELEYHSQQHKNSKGYSCDCGLTFFTYTEMLYHRHPEDGPAPATVRESLQTAPKPQPLITDKDFPAPAWAVEGTETRVPIRTHSDIRSRPYICEYCSKSYPDSRQLATHMYAHRGEKIFNPRASRYLMGRQGIGYTDRSSFGLF